MTEKLVFYTNPMSRGRIVRWMLEEVGAPYETVTVEYGAAMKAPDYLAINPMGKVPALKHGDRVVTECAGICAYLADAFPQAGLAPAPGGLDRASYYRWLFYAAGPVEAAIMDRRFGVEVTEERRRSVGYGTFDEMVDVIDRAVGANEHVAGGPFSAADVYLGSQIGFGLMFGTLPKRPNFEAYVARLSSRPAAIRARAIDEAGSKPPG